jgi:hypothetical protein
VLRRLALVLPLLLVPAAPAAAKSFELPHAVVSARLETDGSCVVSEAITFRFHGSFSGAYRDVPTANGTRVADVSVSEGGERYVPGAPTARGSDGPARSSGV